MKASVTSVPARLLLPTLAVAALAGASAAQFPWGEVPSDPPLMASTPVAGDEFGIAVALSGNRAAVGARLDDTGALNAGAVYVLDRNLGGPGAWGEALVLTNSDAAVSDLLGSAVSIGGNLVVAGSMKTVLGLHHGATYLFDATTGTEIAKLTDTDARATNFGQSVATDGVNVVVGENFQGSGFGSNTGRIAVYDAVGTLRFYLTGSDTDANDWFGTRVAVEGPYIVAAAELKENGGAVYVFDAATGVELRRLVGTGVVGGSNFGHELDVDGGRLIAGGSRNAWVFDLATGSELWRFQGEGFSYSGFGSTGIAIAGDTAYVGGTPSGGVASIFQVCLGSGLTTVAFANRNPLTEGSLGAVAIAADGDTLVSGDGNFGLALFSKEGCINVMSRRNLGLTIDKTQVLTPGAVVLTMRGGAPTLPGGIALTAVNGVPIAPVVIFVGAYDGLGGLVTPPLPVTTSLSGLTLELIGGGVAKSGAVALSNTVDVVLQ